MLRWLGQKKASTYQDRNLKSMNGGDFLTEDPLAIIDSAKKSRNIYSVSRINPLYDDVVNAIPLSNQSSPISNLEKRCLRHKSFSSGYSGSNQEIASHDLFDSEQIKFREDGVSILEQNEDYVKSIQVGCNQKRMPSRGSSVSGNGGNLAAIPEGKIDCMIPSPVWPDENELLKFQQFQDTIRDSLVDETLLLYTSFSYVPNNDPSSEIPKEVSVKDILLDLSEYINKTSTENKGIEADEILQCIKEKVAASLEALRKCSEEEVKRFCINLSNKTKTYSVVRALSNSSSSDNSSQSSPEWNGGERGRNYSSENDDIYDPASGSSSSGFSDSNKLCVNKLDDILCDHNNLRSALIYATLYRTKLKLTNSDRMFERNRWQCSSNSTGSDHSPKKKLLQVIRDNKPSVWEQYYGVRIVSSNASTTYVPKPTDVPLFPGGRPEADFTLDLPRSEFLNQRMKKEKKWRCRCRLLTTFLGFLFFLLSVMAVSLILTRGKRMFGSMV